MRWIDDAAVQAIEPRLSSNILGAVYEEESAQMDSYRLNLALGRGAELRGASIVQREVTGLVSGGSRICGVKTRLGRPALRRGGDGRRHLEPGLHSLAGTSRFRCGP